jgi:hypothetical protein
LGVDTHVLRLLSESRKRGLSFSSTIMIGRQNYVLGPSDLCSVLNIKREDASALLKESYVESLLKRFGATRIESIDKTAYEQATIVHDLNEPIPEHLKASFSCVFDGGSMEHIFNFPQAIKNCMEMVVVGGHFLGVTVANNHMGHGFYQFSPDLFYRVFSPENGYEVKDVLICETDPGAPWYRVEDPALLDHRVELVNNRPTYIMVVARRVSDVDIFKNPPQQSFYMSQWGRKYKPAGSVSGFAHNAKALAARILPRALKRSLNRMIRGRGEGLQSGLYRRV